MNTPFKMLAPALALPLALGMAAPAAAGPDYGWSEHRQGNYYEGRRDHQRFTRSNRYFHRGVERRIERLNRQLRQARRSGELTRYQRRALRSRINTVRRAYNTLARNGLSRRDIRTINWRIGQAQDALDRARYNTRQRGDRRYHGQRDYRGAY